MMNNINLAKDYINDVLSGNILANEFIKLAVKRHKRFIKESKEKGIYFDESAAERAIMIIKQFRHTGGDAAGKRFQLLGWQAFIIYFIFGWKKKENNARLIRKAYVENSKKNGKTELAAAIALMMFLFDGEKGSQIYVTASNFNQANLCFTGVKKMLKHMRYESETIRRLIPQPLKYKIQFPDAGSYMSILSKNADGAEGVNVHASINDEIHTLKTGQSVFNVESAMVARRQPLSFNITTAGHNKGSYCYQLRKNCIDVLRGIKEDDTLFSLVYTLDKDDDWTDPDLWIKANPSLGINGGIQLSALKAEYKKAVNEGQQQVNYFKTRHLNVWVSAIAEWLPDVLVKESLKPIDWGKFSKCNIYGGLDLSTVFDLSAFVFVTEQDGVFYFNAKLYLPEENIDELEKKHGAPYQQWSKEGFITLTPGNVIDYDYIKKDIVAAADKFNLVKLAYDRKFSTKIISEITAAGIDTMPFSQNTTSFNPAITEFETLIKNNKVRFDNKIIRWMLSNVALFSDLEGARKVSRKHSGKVDGVVALLMAMGQYLICQSEADHIDLADSYKDGIFFL